MMLDKLKELGSKMGLNPTDWAANDVEEEKLGWYPGVPTPQDPLRWGKSFPEGAAITLQNTQMRQNLGYATGKIRTKRNTRAEELSDWEELREAGSVIKRNTLANLPELLETFEQKVTERGGIVHWARDADEANEIAHRIIQEKGVDEVVKVKSMATQEINMNSYLEKRGIQAWETDLAEMIVQLSKDMPSHIVVPAIHRNRSEVKAIFEARMEERPRFATDEPRELAMAARAHLRKKFLSAKVAVSGANLGVAETGTLAVYESEGNGRMCLTLPETLITVMGIEKIVPSYRDIEVFSQLLPRSATGERMNPYTSFWTGVEEGDGPQEFHLILMDNGRTNVMKDEVGREALKCIRCAACMNICPVYRVSGGHAYNSVYPGPIGAILTPQLLDATDRKDPATSLPFASTLCGACYDVCPVKINIPEILVHLRHKITDANRGGIPNAWDVAMKGSSKVMQTGKAMGKVGDAMKAGRAVAGKERKIGHLPLPVIKEWTETRDVPAPPAQSFRAWWAERNEEDK